MLSEIQRKLKVPKGQTNKFGGYKYRSCEDILEAVKPVLNEHKCAVVLEDHIEECGGRVYVSALAKLIDENGNTIMQTKAYAREQEAKKGMDEAQITGSASSYARKYALNGLFAIDDTKDADTMTPEENEAPVTKHIRELEKETEAIKVFLSRGQLTEAANIWFNLDDDEKRVLFTAQSKGGPFTPKEREVMKSTEFREAHFGKGDLV